jgi:hypothetical protein
LTWPRHRKLPGSHHPRTAASHNHETAGARSFPGFADQAAEVTGNVIIGALGKNALGDGQLLTPSAIAGVLNHLLTESAHLPLGRSGFADSRAAANDDSTCDLVLLKEELGFGVVEL